MRIHAFLTAFSLFSTPLFAQHHVDVSLSSGIGKSALITDFEEEKEIQTVITDKYSATYNVQVNYFFQKNHWIAETGIGYNLIKGSTKETFNAYDFFNQNEYDRYATHETRRAHYLTIPVTIHYQFNKLRLGAGVYAGIHLTDYSFIQFYRNEMPNGFQQGGNRLSSFDIGATAKVHYALNDQFGIQATMNYGFSDVSNGNQTGAIYQTFQLREATNRELKNRQFLLGISYRLF